MSETLGLHTGLIILIVSLFLYVGHALLPSSRILHGFAWGTLALSTVSLGISLWIRSETAEYFALSNMFESLLALIILMQIGFLILDLKFKQPGWGWSVVLLSFTALSYDLTLPRDIMPLQAALVSYWRAIHVPVIISSYAMFSLAFLASVGYLLTQWPLFQKWTQKPLAFSSGGPSLQPTDSGTQTVMAQKDIAEPQWHAQWIPEATTTTGVSVSDHNPYDEITYRCVALGFPLLTIGIILGGLWANEAWGNYWSWDPKESMSLVTLLGYGVYLHMRMNGGFSGNTLAWVSIAAYSLMLITYFGVNIMGVGLHSYGKIG